MFLTCQTIILSLILAEISAIPISDDSNRLESSIVEIRNVRRMKRNINDGNPGYELELKAFDKIHNLKLRSVNGQLVSDNFDLTVVDGDGSGNILKVRRTPSKREIQEMERSIYLDHNSNAILSVRETDNGEIDLEGILGQMRIRRNEEDKIVAIKEDKSNEPRQMTEDSVDLKRPIATPRGLSQSPVSVTPELLLTFDYGNCKLFNFDYNKIMKYLLVLTTAMNARFGTLDDPKVKFILSGIVAINSTDGQKFVQDSYTNGTTAKTSKDTGRVIVNELLTMYNIWIRGNTFPKHDVSALLFSDKVSGGAAGMAYVSGACGPRQGVVMSHSGGNWDWVMGVAHEICHAFGCADDELEKEEGCRPSPSARAGYGTYVMLGGGAFRTDKYTFSSCAARKMKGFIQSTAGSCLWTRENPHPPPQTLKLSSDPDQRCKEITGYENATMDDTRHPDEQCFLPVCEVQFSDKSIKLFDTIPAEENTICGTTGKCQLGKCVNATMMDMPQICKKRMGDVNAYLRSDEPSEQCLKMECVQWYGNVAHVHRHGPAEEGTPCGRNRVCGGGQCIWPNNHPKPRPNTFAELCKEEMGVVNATFDDSQSPDEQCNKLLCRDPTEGNIKKYIFGRVEDGTICGTTNTCQDGKCLKKKNRPRLSKGMMTRMCQMLWGNEMATVDDSQRPDDACSQLLCRVGAATQILPVSCKF